MTNPAPAEENNKNNHDKICEHHFNLPRFTGRDNIVTDSPSCPAKSANYYAKFFNIIYYKSR
jgi:hypothetical protein